MQNLFFNDSVKIASTLSTQEQLLYITHTKVLAGEQVPSYWMMWNVLVLRPGLWIAITMELAHITVTTTKMLVSDVKASNCALKVNLTVVLWIIIKHFSYIHAPLTAYKCVFNM